MAANIEDVARLAGVARGTVSNVMNRPEIVAPKTLERVREAMRKLDFVPNESARVLAGGDSRFVGVVIHDAANPFFSSITRAIEEIALEKMYTVATTSTGADPTRELAALELLVQQRPKGVLLTPAAVDALGVARLRGIGSSVVLLDSEGREDECSVSVDDRAGGRLAGAHLASLARQAYLFVGAPARATQHRERLEGYREALTEAGVSSSQPTVLEPRQIDVASGRELAAQVADLAADGPIAVFCGNDLLALGVMFGLSDLGVDVPARVAICGYDDIDMTQYVSIPLTTVHQPTGDMGRTSFTLLLDEMTNSRHEHSSVRFQPSLVVRASTATVA